MCAAKPRSGLASAPRHRLAPQQGEFDEDFPSQVGRPPCPRGYPRPWHSALGVSELCCPTEPATAIKSTGAGTAQGEKHRGAMPASPGTWMCQPHTRPVFFAGSSIPACLVPNVTGMWGHYGLSRPVSLVPGDDAVPRLGQGVPSSVVLMGAATRPILGLRSPAFPTPMLGVSQMNRPPLRAILLPVLIATEAQRGGLGDAHPPGAHSSGFCLSWEVQKPCCPRGGGAEPQHRLNVPMSPPSGVSQDEDLWARGGRRWLEVTLACQCHHPPAVPPSVPTQL